MWWFLGGIALLIGGYLTYGRLVEKIVGRMIGRLPRNSIRTEWIT